MIPFNPVINPPPPRVGMFAPLGIARNDLPEQLNSEQVSDFYCREAVRRGLA
jgi:hypothetical protein